MPQPTADPWLADFRDLLASGRREEAFVLLESRSTAHAGTPKSAEKLAAAKLLIEQDGGRPEELLASAEELAASSSPTRRELACVLLPACYESARTRVQSLMPVLADDAHWEMRLWAGSHLFAALLGRHLDDLYPIYQRWASHESQFVRLAVATSVRDPAHRDHPERAEPFFDLIEPLLSDRAHEVQRNLGPFAIGDAMLRFFPMPTLERVRAWARSDDEVVRWNAAMVFSAAEARKHVDVALEVLSDLARDRRRFVWQAVSSALGNLAKGDPERLAPILRSWLADERKLPAALALRRIGG